MKPISNNPSILTSSYTFGAAIVLFLAPSHLQADVTFNNFNNGGLDSVGIDGSVTLTDPSVGIGVTLETVDLLGQNGLLTSSGDPLTANVTNSNNLSDLGVNSEENVGGYGSQSRDFNPGEAWIFKFDVDVTLNTIRFAGYGAGAEMTVTSTALASPVVINSGDAADLGATMLTAGTEVTVQMTSDNGTEEEPNDTGMRLDYLTVSAVPPVSSGDNLVWAGSDGDAWNTTDANFTGDDTVFATDDNVEIQTPGAINIDAGGITAGVLTDTTVSGTVTLQTGNLTSTRLTKSGAGTLLVASPLDVAGALTLSGGIVQVGDGATLTATSASFSGGATLQIDSGATFTAEGGGVIDTGGAILDTEEPVSLGFLSNSVVDVPFTKTGSGVLTMTGDLGLQSTGPVVMDILAGSVIAASGTQLNFGSTSVLDGDVTLEGAKIEFHGSTVSGTGSIIADSGNARIDARFNGGTVTVANGIIANSDFIVEAPTGDSELHLDGPISGVGNILKDGNGLVFFAATNTYEGTTTVDSGTLVIGGGPGSTSGSLGVGAVILNETSSLGNLEFRRDDSIVVGNPISGLGSVTIEGGDVSSVELNGANTYEGNTVLENGTLVATVIDDVGFESSIGFGSSAADTIELRGGALSYTGATDASTDRSVFLGAGGGVISADGAGSLEFSLESLVEVGTGTLARTLTLGGSVAKTNIFALEIVDGTQVVDGPPPAVVSLAKTGSTTWSHTSFISYTGDTTVEEGTLILSDPNLDDASGVTIGMTGAFLQLEFAEGVDTVGSLDVGEGALPDGRYGPVGSADMTDTELTQITGSGYLEVITPVTDYSIWAESFSLVGGPTDDDDNDGVSNEDEYAFGLSPVDGSSVNPISVQLEKATGTFSYTRRDPALTGLTYVIETSTTLGGWDEDAEAVQTPGTTDGDGNQTVVVTLSSIPTDPSFFVRATTGS